MLIYLLRDSLGSNGANIRALKRGKRKSRQTQVGVHKALGQNVYPILTSMFNVEVLTQNRSLFAAVEVLTLFLDKTAGNKILFWVSSSYIEISIG